jgi:hypothetical protein
MYWRPGGFRFDVSTPGGGEDPQSLADHRWPAGRQRTLSHVTGPASLLPGSG